MTNIVNNIFTTRVRNTFMLIAMLCSISSAAWADPTKSTWDGTVPSTANVTTAVCNGIGITGSGTEADPYVISTAQQFAYFASKMNGNTAWWKLAANVEIDLDGTNRVWTYGQNNANFKGHFDGNKASGSLISNMKFETNGANKSFGLFPQLQGSSVTNHAEIKNLTISNFQITTPGSGTSYGATTNVALLVGKANSNTDIENVTVSNGTITYNVTTTGGNNVGGMVGLATGDNNTLKKNTVSSTGITTGTALKKEFYVGGLAGNVATNAVVVGNTVSSISISLGGNCNGYNYIGGLIGKVAGTNSTVAAGLPMGKRSLVQQNTVTSPTIAMNGSVELKNFELGGLIGWIGSHTNVFNNKVTSPTISVTNNINADSYVGGAVGFFDTKSFIDGVTVSGGSISGPASDKIVKNNVIFFVGGFLGVQHSSGAGLFEANKFKNVAVTGMNINLGKYKPGGAIQNHKFSVGGVAASANAPNIKSDGAWSGMPENIISKGGKIYAPWASTSPTVSIFNNGSAAHNNVTPDVVTTVDVIEKAKVNTWYYNDYKLGLSSEFLGSTSVIAQNATPEHLKFRKNYVRDLTTVDGVSYLPFDDTNNDGVLIKSNRYLDSERELKTVLWWTKQATMNKSTGAQAAVTDFTANEQPIYPQSGATAAQAGNLSEYPHYMYFFQGVGNAKYVLAADAANIAAGIEARINNNIVPSAAFGPTGEAIPSGVALTATQCGVSAGSLGDNVSVTIFNEGEARRGFDNRTLSVKVRQGETDVTSTYTYQWYVDGVANGTGSTKVLAPHWKNGQGVTVNVLSGSTVVAAASYGFAPGVLNTKNNDPIRSDINARGTSTNPYIIDHENALRQMSYLSTAHTSTRWEGVLNPAAPYPTNQPQGHYNRAYYEMSKDITLSNDSFVPISHVGYSADGTWGTYNTNWIFQGVFDGKGHKISNLRMAWTAGQYNGNTNIYCGLFGCVGNAAAAPKWGDTANGNTVIKNLIIDGAVLTHDIHNTTFAYPNSTNANYAMVGVLAGIVTSNTTIQNIEIRNSSITDVGSNDYSLASKGLYVGGAIGAVQAAYNATTNVPANTQIQHIAANVDITLTKPTILKESDATQTGSFNVGGIIGRYVATGATKDQVEPTLPSYTIYSGTVNAPKAWVSPVVASLRYNAQQSFNFNNHSKHWEGNNNSAATQVAINNALYYNFYIGTNKITDTYPSNTCGQGNRTMTAHSDGSDAALTYSAAKYQGVNYGARYVDVEGASLENMNGEPFEGYNWVWSSGFVHMSTEPYVEARISREGDTFTATLVGGTATKYKWQASFDGATWHNIPNIATETYAAPKSLKPKFIVAFISDGTTTEGGETKYYRTLVELVEPNKDLISPTVTQSTDKTQYTFNLGNTAPVAHLTPVVEWYYTKDDANSTSKNPEATTTTWTPTPASIQGGIVWCKIKVTELGVTVYEDLLLSGATVVFVDGTNGYDNDGSTYIGRGYEVDKPVKTIDHANSLLKTSAEGGSVDNNIIVVIGTLNPKDGSTYVPFHSRGTNPATLTGKFNNIDYNGKIILAQWHPNTNGSTAAGSSEHVVNPVHKEGVMRGSNCYILADTKFEYLTFEAHSNSAGNNFIELHGNDAIFGKGLVMTNFKKLSRNHGNFGEATEIPELTIILTATNLPKEDIDAYTNRTKPQVVTFQSGHYGRLMAGRFTEDFFAKPENTAHSILGSAAKPVWAVVNIEIDSNNQMTDGSGKTYGCDINAIIAGLTDGSMYGDYTINFYGGHVAYIVGSNQGNAVNNGNATYTPTGGTSGSWGQWPNSSYFGRTVINVEEKHAVNTAIKPITVGNLYAGGLGRESQSSNAKAAVDMYLYGRTEVNVKSGTVSGSVYGGGVGGVIGVNPWDAHVPYITTSADDATSAIQDLVQYGDNRQGTWSSLNPATATMAKVTLHNLNDAGTDYIAEDLDLKNSSTTVNVIGGAVNGHIYGGGYGKVTEMPAASAVQGIGSVFGTTNINITGGTITGNVYGGSEGDSYYHNTKNKYGQTITHIAEMNGTVNLNISGTEEHYPTINGNIFGAGKGIASAAARTAVQDDVTNGRSSNVGDAIPAQEFADIARTGTPDNQSTINITVDLPESHPFTGNIYGGGQMGKVDGTINIFARSGVIAGNIFGAGLGEAGHIDTKAMVNGNTYVNIQGARIKPSNTAGTGNVFGGGSLGKVIGSTNVTIDDGAVETNVYGGGDQGVVTTKANVTINGGELLGNVFGGGNKAIVGTAYASGERTAWAEANGTSVVLGSKDAYVYGDIFGGGNEANVEGNTSIRLDAGNFGGNIFGGGNGLLDASGNVTTSANVTGNTYIYIAEDEGGQDQETKVDNFNINVIWDKKWSPSAKSFLTWESNKTQFYDSKFLDNHNIYGGGNNACLVGTYANTNIDVATKPTAGTGLASVKVFKGMTPVGLLRTTEWKHSYNDNNNPHFYVFGGGYGKNTKVGSTDVTVNVGGDYGEYSNEVDSPTEQLSKPGNGFGNRNSTTDSTDPATTKPVFDNSYGIPNFTVLGALGGGYAGLVAGNTKVTIDGKTFLHRVYGGGFGNPNSTADNTTGQVGGNTDVHVNGAHIYGDVFGGGAGVAKTTAILDNVARVLGKTSVTVADDANIYGKVFGGGDMACVGVAATDETPRDYATSVSSASSKSSDASWTYTHSNHQTFVNILGGNIFGEVYGGGKGVKKGQANDYTKVGRIEGNTLVHIACSQPTADGQNWVVVPEATSGAIVPNVWNRIYGGCAYGTVDGNTMVHTEGGMLGLNIFGGGYGDMNITDDQTDSSSGASTASSTLNQVLGKLDTDATFANILGNTKVQIDGGSWIWNRKADTNGNITTWEDANKTVTNGLEGFKLLVAQILQAKTQAELEQIEAVKSIDPNFFTLSTRQFFKNHNIFGGGNRACFVGKYSDTNASSAAAPADNTGKAEVIINHSPITKIADANGNEINMLDPSTVAGLCWYLGINNIEHPQFSVFGAGYGANTKVGEAIVKAQPGIQLKVDGTLLKTDTPKYLNEESDLMAWFEFDQEIAASWDQVSIDDRKRYYGLADENSTSKNVYLRYRASQLAWSMGSPNFTFMDVHGGGFSGYVVGNTSVTTDCQLNARNIFGAGLGSKPYGLTNTTTQAAANAFTLGQVGGNASVFIKSGVVSLNVYGGGAGIESYKIGDATTYTDFPNIALVKGKTKVDVYGESIEVGTDNSIPADMRDKRIERTMIFGSVYGGGDVANVGTSSLSADVLTSASTNFTTTVNVRGGSIQAQVYAGGNGRLADGCHDYKKLGSVYGNTRLIVDSADDTYPYESSPKTPNAIASPHIWNRIYGGCQNGTVYGNTLVEIKGGSLGHNVFGGGFGDDGTGLGHSTGDEEYAVQLAELPQSRVATTITSSDVTGNTNIFVTGGEMELTSYWRPETRTWEPATITNEGKAYSPQYNVSARKFKINHNIYGGANAAGKVSGSSYITMSKGLLKATTQTLAGVNQPNFFESLEWHEVYDKVGSPHFAIFGGGYGEQTEIVGNTNLNINMDGAVSSDSHTVSAEQGYLLFQPQASVMDIVGGGYSGKVTGQTYVTVDGGTYARRVFGGGFYNSVNTTNVQINAIDCDDVFGGGLMGDVLTKANVTVGVSAAANNNIHIHNNIYGGNDVSGYINLTDKNAGSGDIEFEVNNENGGTSITAYGGHIYGNIYGAGNGDYLYALDQQGNTKVTVNEHYKQEGSEDEYDLVYTVPMRSTMASAKAASDAQKIVNINSWRPLTNKVAISLSGTSGHNLQIDGNVFGGGNSATVMKAKQSGGTTMVGGVALTIGSNINVGGVYLGSDGDQLFVNASENAFLQQFQTLNDLSLENSIDWLTDPANHGISEAYLPTANANRPTVYPHLLDLYFQPVEMSMQPTVTWETSLANCTIGTFCCGGNRGNMNVAPDASGNIVNITFPTGLTITDKIIGGCNRANYIYDNPLTGTTTTHTGGYLLGKSGTAQPVINIKVENKFQPASTTGDDAHYIGGNVYGGCYETGTINGDVKIDFLSDMLNGFDNAKLTKSNDLGVSTCNVYGAGFGTESYVRGNVKVDFGDAATTNTSANFVFGGGQQGNVVGNTTVHVRNGHIFKSVTGGSYAGFLWGSTEVLVGYPKYYVAQKSGVYHLARTDKDPVNLAKTGVNGKTIKQTINILKGDIVSEQVYDAITISDKSTYFSSLQVSTPTDWSKINITIGEAVYGGGYSLASGSSVLANNTTVLKMTSDYNIDESKTEEDLATTVGYGGNTTMLIADKADDTAEHITISSQVMKAVTLPNGTDLYGYYYKDTGNKYHYIYQAGTYHAGSGATGWKLPEGASGNAVYQFDAEGGIFGDGHLSYAEGFRNAEVTGYGYAQHTVTNPKIINTFQRMDMLRLTDNCFTLLGARDYTVNEISTNPYSVARVGEIQMFSSIDSNSNLKATSEYKARNFMGFSNNIHYIGAIYSNVSFGEDKWHKADGSLVSSSDYISWGAPGDLTELTEVGGVSYQALKQLYINVHKEKGTGLSDEVFSQRNDGTAKNMIGIASGYALKIQNVREYLDTDNHVKEELYYGPISGVVEVNLIDCSEDEGGGYVYAANIHDRGGATEDFLETSGNFVFPYSESDGRHVVDDCFPIGYDSEDGHNSDGHAKQDVHYWYVTGFNYFYNAHITGYTSNSDNGTGINFDMNNADGLMKLAGAKAGQTPIVYSVTWRSGHQSDYNCDLKEKGLSELGTETQTSGKYWLGISAADEGKYKTQSSAYYIVPFTGKTHTAADDANPIYMQGTIPTGLGSDANIGIRLHDQVNNSGSEYYKQHLSEPCEATIVLTLPALDGNNQRRTGYARIKAFYTYDSETQSYDKVTTGSSLSSGTTYYYYNSVLNRYSPISGLSAIKVRDGNGAYETASSVTAGSQDYFIETRREYTYTIYLTIDYVQGPTAGGNITINNCALPGEMIKLSTENVKIEGDESMTPNGYYWRIGKLNSDGTAFQDQTTWNPATPASGYDTYKVGSTEKNGVFAGCSYNATDNALYVPAYYFMNGYGVQYGFTVSVNGQNDMFEVPIQKDANNIITDKLLVHNYHRMDPRTNIDGFHLHLSEAVARAKAEPTTFAEPRIYLADTRDLAAFVNFIDTVGTAGKTLAADAKEYVKIGTASCEVPRYGANAQFVVQNDLTIPDGYDPANYHNPTFAGTVHGNGHLVTGLNKSKSLIGTNNGHIYNLGMASGKIATTIGTEGRYHCSYEYNDNSNTHKVYDINGNQVTTYTDEDFKYGRVAYDLNQYYLARRANSSSDPDAAVADAYLKAYYGNGDYQYARRRDSDTKNETGVTYLRTGVNDTPGYGTADTRHNMSHPIDKARAKFKNSSAASTTSTTSDPNFNGYDPLFNAAQQTDGLGLTEVMNDYLFWGQNLQPDQTGKWTELPTTIASSKVNAMTNRVWAVAGYYRDAIAAGNYSTGPADGFYHNAFKSKDKTVGTFVHDPRLVTIDFTTGRGGDTPDISSIFNSFKVDNGLTHNLLVYTAENGSLPGLVSETMRYTHDTPENDILGHHVKGSTTPLLHLIDKNDFYASKEFTVSDNVWYVRNPQEETGYVESPGKAWESICLPFDVTKVTLSEGIQKYTTNGVEETPDGMPMKDITFFYGSENISHDYWLRKLTEVKTDAKKAVFTLPADNVFPANVPHIVSFPGSRFYEFNMTGQTMTFSAEKDATVYVSDLSVNQTTVNGYTYRGAFVNEEGSDSKYAIRLNTDYSGVAGDKFELDTPIYPFRAYLTAAGQGGAKGSRAIGSDLDVIYISSPHEIPGIDIDDPQRPDDEFTGAYLRAYPIGKQRLCIESSYATTLKVFTPSGQLYRVLEVRPGTATYSGFQPGIYIVNGKKLRAE